MPQISPWPKLPHEHSCKRNYNYIWYIYIYKNEKYVIISINSKATFDEIFLHIFWIKFFDMFLAACIKVRSQSWLWKSKWKWGTRDQIVCLKDFLLNFDFPGSETGGGGKPQKYVFPVCASFVVARLQSWSYIDEPRFVDLEPWSNNV